jgi:hypothetical protein
MMILAAILIAGPVSSGALARAQAQDHDEVLILRQRVEEYWAGRVRGDYRRQWDCWALHCGRYDRRRGAIDYVGYEVGDVKIEGNSATVHVKVTARITLAGSQAKPVVKTVTMPDAWVKAKGIWYRRADQPAPPTPPPATVPPSEWVW